VIAHAVLLLLVQAQPPEALPGGRAMAVYYQCAAEKADDLTLDNRGIAKRPGEAIAGEAIDFCSRLRDPAFEAVLPGMMGDRRVQDYLRDRHMTADQGRQLASYEFDRALRHQLVRNVAKLRGEAVPESSDAED
jgi:hypothetical protein